MPGALYEPQQFIIASGVYTSQGSSGASAPLRVWTPLARNLNPGDGVFLVWQALTSASSIPTIITQLLELCELNQKRWESLTIPNQAPSGFGG